MSEFCRKRADVAPFFANFVPCLIGLEAGGSAHHIMRGVA
jgi:hypothetical protein